MDGIMNLNIRWRMSAECGNKNVYLHQNLKGIATETHCLDCSPPSACPREATPRIVSISLDLQ